MSFSEYLNSLSSNVEDKALADRRQLAEELTTKLGIKPPQGFSNMDVTPEDIENLFNMVEKKNAEKKQKEDDATSSAGTTTTADNDDDGSIDEFQTYCAEITKVLHNEGWASKMIPAMTKAMWEQHKATVVNKKDKSSDDKTGKPTHDSPKPGKRKREDDPYADCKSPDKWPADLLKSIMDAAGLKKGKKDEMAEALNKLIIHFVSEK